MDSASTGRISSGSGDAQGRALLVAVYVPMSCLSAVDPRLMRRDCGESAGITTSESASTENLLPLEDCMPR